jgi:hypothetical protein
LLWSDSVTFAEVLFPDRHAIQEDPPVGGDGDDRHLVRSRIRLETVELQTPHQRCLTMVETTL